LNLHGGQDELILSAKLIRIAPETSSFLQWLLWQEFVFFANVLDHSLQATPLYHAGNHKKYKIAP
jgi:hypothetical protein